MAKVVKNGKVAILYSPGYGAGWYSWNTDHEEAIFSPEVVEWVLNGKPESELPNTKELFGREFFDGGMDQLIVRWVDSGTHFRISEYDGSEYVEIRDRLNWIEA